MAVANSHAIKVSDKMYKEAKAFAKAEHRSTSKQLQYWASFGKLCLENPDLPGSFVKELLVSQNEESIEFELTR